MKPATHSERERFVADLIRHAPAADAWFASRLMRYSGTYQRAFADSHEAKLFRARKAIKGLCADMGCSVVFAVPVVTIIAPDNYAIGVPAI
jgi:hypothetical protein